MDNINNKFNYEAMKLFLKRRWLYIFLPILYFIYKINILITYGLYATYNKVSIENIFNLIPKINKSFYTMTNELFYFITNDIVITILVLIFSFLISFLFKIKENFFDTKVKIFSMIFLSIVLFILAVFPYLMVNKQQVLYSWNGRFSLLLGISISLMYIIVISIISSLFLKYKNKIFLFLISTVILLFIAKNIIFQYKQNIDWFYQVSIIENFKSNNKIKDNTTFVVYSKINHKFVDKRIFVYYEWNGLLKKAFGNTKRLMIPPFQKHLLSSINGSRLYKQYNFYEWNNNQKITNVILHKKSILDYKDQTKLYFYYIFNYDKFLILTKNLIYITTS
jgi:hypothetical protein